ncbi:anterior gradient 1 precursor [Silurus meridionalis]|nr:anterior gradient 1 precursor [Silurus meridionalis]
MARCSLFVLLLLLSYDVALLKKTKSVQTLSRGQFTDCLTQPKYYLQHETTDANMAPDGYYVPRILFVDPSLTVRSDITGKYTNRKYAYIPEDLDFLGTFQSKCLEQRLACLLVGAEERSIEAWMHSPSRLLGLCFRDQAPVSSTGQHQQFASHLSSRAAQHLASLCALSTTSGQAQISQECVFVCVWMIHAGGQSKFSSVIVYHYKAITHRENLINRTCNAATPSRRRNCAGGGKFLALISAGTSGLVLNQTADSHVTAVGYTHHDLQQF